MVLNTSNIPTKIHFQKQPKLFRILHLIF